MWFKNLVLYRLTEPFAHSPEELAGALAADKFKPCGGLEASSYGWEKPLGRMGSELVHAANGRILISARKEQRLLPPAVVRETLEERIERVETHEHRKVRAKERSRMRDEVVFELLPRAFTGSTLTNAYISPQDGWIVVDTARLSKAEELVVLLGQSLGWLGAEPYTPATGATVELTKWLTDGAAPAGLSLGDECELREPADGGAVVRCLRQDLNGDEIRAHLRSRKLVQKLSLIFEERLSFVLHTDLTIKRLKMEAVDELDWLDDDDEIARFDADFALMTTEYSRLLERLVNIFGAG